MKKTILKWRTSGKSAKMMKIIEHEEHQDNHRKWKNKKMKTTIETEDHQENHRQWKHIENENIKQIIEIEEIKQMKKTLENEEHQANHRKRRKHRSWRTSRKS